MKNCLNFVDLKLVILPVNLQYKRLRHVKREKRKRHKEKQHKLADKDNGKQGAS